MAKGARRKGPFAPIEDALAAIRAGRMIVVVDDKDRENEGDVVFAAAKSTPARSISWPSMPGASSAWPCPANAADRNCASSPCPTSLSRHDTAFTISVEVREGTTTGISAADRS